MSLIEVKADFGRLAASLERIADALERAYPLPPLPRRKRPVDLRDVSVVTNEKLWDLEQDGV